MGDRDESASGQGRFPSTVPLTVFQACIIPPGLLMVRCGVFCTRASDFMVPDLNQRSRVGEPGHRRESEIYKMVEA